MLHDPSLRVVQAHKRSIFHRAEILASARVGCFRCLRVYAPERITEWTDLERTDDKEPTAVCPFCGIDAVLGDASGFPVEPAFLQEMQTYWFARPRAAAAP